MSQGNPEGALRLQALIAKSGLASRRAAERLIVEGRVAVNGVVVRELGAKALPGDTVAVDGKEISHAGERIRYVAMNKPRGYVCSMSDPRGHPLARSLLDPTIRERLYNVGRLDMWSSGLIVFTNDGEYARRLSHPSSGVEKEYIVELDAEPDMARLSRFVDGFSIDGVLYRFKGLEPKGRRSLSVVLVEGKNREIRRCLEWAGYRVRSLARIRIGGLRLGGLAEGSSREMSEEEAMSVFESEAP